MRGKVKVGEAGLVATAGAEFIPPLDTTEEAGTCRARRSALGLVGSSVGGVERRKGEEEGKEGRKERRKTRIKESYIGKRRKIETRETKKNNKGRKG